jgi:hypothetical protein
LVNQVHNYPVNHIVYETYTDMSVIIEAFKMKASD